MRRKSFVTSSFIWILFITFISCTTQSKEYVDVITTMPAQYVPNQIDQQKPNEQGVLLVAVSAILDLLKGNYLSSKAACENYVRYGAPNMTSLNDLVNNTLPKILSDMSACHQKLFGSSIKKGDIQRFRSLYMSDLDSASEMINQFSVPVPQNRQQLNLCPLIEQQILKEINDFKKVTNYPNDGWCNASKMNY